MTDKKDIEQTENTAQASGTGHAQNVVISDTGWKAMVIIAVIFAALVLMTNRTSNQAVDRANAAERAAVAATNQAAMTGYWMQRASLACQTAGVQMPPIPAVIHKAD